jgi:hypothetical protein
VTALSPEAWVERLKRGEMPTHEEALELAGVLEVALGWKPGPKARVTPAVAARIEALLARHFKVGAACEAEGISRSTWMRYQRRLRGAITGRVA